jgi:CHAT domain-containing protein/predicted negative regulator of RcsB-dependent stress response
VRVRTLNASALVLALFALSSCHRGSSDVDLQRTFDAANLAFRHGELTEARALSEQGMTSAGPRGDSVWSWRFRLLRGDILISQRNLGEVRSLTHAVMPAGASFDSLRAQQALLDARLMIADRRLDDALLLARRVGEIAPPQDRQLRFYADMHIGQILFQKGRWDQGEALLTGTERAASEAGDHYYEAFALHQLGMGQFVRNRFDQALAFFERVLAFPDLSEMSIYAKALNNAGMCYSRLGMFERAVDAQRRALALQAKYPRSADYEQALGQLGNTYLLQQDFKNGASYVQRALQVARDAGITEDAALWAGNLAQAHIESGQWAEAERYNEEAKHLRASTRGGDTAYYALNSAYIAKGRRQLDVAEHLLQSLAAGTAPPGVMWNAQAGLGDVARAQGDSSRAAHHYQAALDIIEQTRSELFKTDYKLSYLTQLISFYQGYVEALLRQGLTERALEVADSSRGRVLAARQGGKAPPRVGVSSFRTLSRQTGSVFLSYWLAPAKSYVWVIADSGIRCLELPPEEQIRNLVRAHQSAIANVLADSLNAPQGAGSQLYQMLVAPAIAGLPAGTRFVIVPDGALHAVNFETLPVDGPKRHYWIEDAEIQIAPSLASMTTTKPVSTAARSLLLIGNPTPHTPEYPALGYAGAEMTDIARHFETANVTSYDGVKASPAIYRAARPEQFSFIHFTAHATANFESPLDSAVILSGPDQGYKLYARDVAARPLTAELVTVSACRSAGERAYSGEGLVGFSWAFLRAGARRVVAGLWDVDDRSTAELMDRMYGALAAGDPPARALRRAKLALIAQGGAAARPYNWGAFEVFTVTP